MSRFQNIYEFTEIMGRGFGMLAEGVLTYLLRALFITLTVVIIVAVILGPAYLIYASGGALWWNMGCGLIYLSYLGLLLFALGES